MIMFLIPSQDRIVKTFPSVSMRTELVSTALTATLAAMVKRIFQRSCTSLLRRIGRFVFVQFPPLSLGGTPLNAELLSYLVAHVLLVDFILLPRYVDSLDAILDA